MSYLTILKTFSSVTNLVKAEKDPNFLFPVDMTSVGPSGWRPCSGGPGYPASWT
jgi:hypothetical protein